MVIPKNPRPDEFSRWFAKGLHQTNGYRIDALEDGIKIDQNEACFDWPDWIKEKIARELVAKNWNLYPSSYDQELQQAVATYAGVDAEGVCLGPGSNYLVTMLVSMFATNLRGELIIARPTFPLYEAHCRYFDIPYRLWLLEELEYSPASLGSLMPGSVVFFSSPNNPIGNTLPTEDLATLLADNPESYFVADEAYYEFSRSNYAPLLADFGNLVLLRTFSKSFAAAGIRLGYVLSSAAFAAELRKIVVPFLLNQFTLISMTTALQDDRFARYLMERNQQVVEERDRLYQALDGNDGFRVYNTETNFLTFITAPERVDHYYLGLKNAGVIVRNISKGPGLAGHLRISVGTPDQNKKVIQAFANL